jgi:hypothetical protein
MHENNIVEKVVRLVLKYEYKETQRVENNL